jgi:VanZ family protein
MLPSTRRLSEADLHGTVPHLSIFLKYNLWAILWGFLIIALTALPGKSFPKLPDFLDLFHPDKLIHVFIFGVYVFLQIRGLSAQPVYPTLSRNAVVITMLIGLSLGAGTEILQDVYVPRRFGSIYDFIANVAGCFVGWGIAVRLRFL